jgi:hypothetical protein
LMRPIGPKLFCCKMTKGSLVNTHIKCWLGLAIITLKIFTIHCELSHEQVGKYISKTA